jgi:hypothetical protein
MVWCIRDGRPACGHTNYQRGLCSGGVWAIGALASNVRPLRLRIQNDCTGHVLRDRESLADLKIPSAGTEQGFSLCPRPRPPTAPVRLSAAAREWGGPGSGGAGAGAVSIAFPSHHCVALHKCDLVMRPSETRLWPAANSQPTRLEATMRLAAASLPGQVYNACFSEAASCLAIAVVLYFAVVLLRGP